MPFNSFAFILLLIVVLLFYYLPALARYQIHTLIMASLFFYGYSQPVLVLLLLLSATINIVTSYFIVYGHDHHRKFFAICGVGLNLLILLFFKYGPLLSRTFFYPDASMGQFLLNLPLPLGISFFTFQGISLVVDVFQGKYIKPRAIIPVSFCEHAKRALFFKAFFPQLIAGPIVKAHEFLPQIGHKTVNDVNFERAFRNLVAGYFLKMVVADNLKDFTFWISYPHFQGKSTTSLIVMLFGYSCQIFADFAGYSLIALGLAQLFGYHLRINFNFPYVSRSFSEFWARWHISLSTFLKEYLYIPLGGNRKGSVRTYINLMTTMVLGGLWHGAAWSYAVWGFYHGALLVIERFLQGRFSLGNGKLVQCLKAFTVFFLVTLSWLLFKLPEFPHVVKYLQAIFHNRALYTDGNEIFYLLIYCLPVVIYHARHLLVQMPALSRLKQFDYLPYGIMLFLITTNSGSSGDFIYFQF